MDHSTGVDAMSVAAYAMRMFGGWGCVRGCPVETQPQDATTLQIAAKTNWVRRNEILQALVERSPKDGGD